MSKKSLFIALVFFGFLANELCAMDKSQLSITIDTRESVSPLFFFVTDPDGRKTGRLAYEPPSYSREIPVSEYEHIKLPDNSDDPVNIDESEKLHFGAGSIVPGTYLLTIHAIRDAHVILRIRSFDIDGNSSSPSPNRFQVDLVAGTSVQYRINADPSPGRRTTILKVETGAPFNPQLVSQVAASCQGLFISGNAKLFGPVSSGGVISLSGNAIIQGNAMARELKKSSNGRIEGSFVVSTGSFNCNPIDLAGLENGANDNAKLPAAVFKNGGLSISGDAKVVIPAGTYVLSSLAVSGNAKVTTSGTVRFLVRGEVRVDGNGALSAATPNDLIVLSSSVNPVRVSTNGQMTGMVYAPQSTITMSGNGKVTGHLFGKRIEMSGNAQAKMTN